MSKRYPSLNALRIFEIAARHMSFTKAGEELNMSQAAVSQRIKALEGYLDKPLFYRNNRSLELTEVAMAYLPSVRDAIDRLDRATDQLFEWSDTKHIISIRVASGFATLWLAPHLGSFQQTYPDIDIRLIMSSEIIYEPLESSFDAAIRYGDGNWPDLTVQHLMDVDLFPICSPTMRARIRAPEDLGDHPLIHVMGYDEDWASWLEHHDISSVDHTRGLQVNATITAMQVAQEGGGVALGRTPLIKNLLQSRRLVNPFENLAHMSTGKAYYLVSHKDRPETPELRDFRDWLSQEVEDA